MAKKLKLSNRLFITFLLTSSIALLSFAIMGIIQALGLYKFGAEIVTETTRESLENQLMNQARSDIALSTFPVYEKITIDYQLSLRGTTPRSRAQNKVKYLFNNSSDLRNAGTLIIDRQSKIVDANKLGDSIKDTSSLWSILKKNQSKAISQTQIINDNIEIDGLNTPAVIVMRYLSRWGWYVVTVIPAYNFKYFIDPAAASQILSQLNISDSGYVEVIDENGSVLFHPSLQLRPQIFHKNHLKTILENQNYQISLELAKDTNDYHLLSEQGLENQKYKPNEIKTIKYVHDTTNQWILAFHTYKRDSRATLRKFKLTMVLLSVIFLLIMSLVSYYFSQRLGKNLDNFDTRLGIMASRDEKTDLTRRISVNKVTELSGLAGKFNSIMTNFNSDMLKVKHAAQDLTHTSHVLSDSIVNNMKSSMEGISSSIQSIRENTLNQTSGVEEVNATLEEMSRSIDSMSENMSRQSAAVEESASAIEEMSRNIDNASATAEKTTNISKNLNQVATEGGDAVKNSMASIKDVSEYSQQILKMLKLITDISKQTNLLAMNASIEAAHAGEAGKGFAIVADEIRRLAENTSKNAKDIGDVVNAIVDKIEESVTLAEKAGMGLDMILAYSNQNVNIMSQLNSALEEQNHSAKEILKSTQDMVSVTEEVQVAMTEQKTGTHEFSEIMRNLRDISIETKDSISDHIEKLNLMIKEVEEVNSVSDKNTSLSGELMELIDQFVLDDVDAEDDDTTSLKLVE